MMVERKFGMIVNISSVAGLVSSQDLSYYSISKAGLRALGDSVQSEFYNRGIKVTNVFPFFSNTDILKSERFNINKKIEIPKMLIDQPDNVVREIIEGMELERENIYPGFAAKGLNFISRILPDLLNILRIRM